MSDIPKTTKHPAYPWGKPRRKRRWKRWVFLLLVLAVGIVAALPTIATRPAIMNSVLAKAIPKEQGSITVGEVSAGWFSQVTLRDIQILGADGKKLLDVPSATLDRSILELTTNQADLGTLQLNQPTLHLETRIDGSNVEDFLAPWMGKREDNRAAAVKFKITGGQILAHDLPTGERWHGNELDIAGSVETNESGLPTITTTGQVKIEADGTNGTLSFALNPSGEGRQTLELKTNALPLAPFKRWLHRAGLDQNTQLAGKLTLDSTSKFKLPASDQINTKGPLLELESTGDVVLTELQVAGPFQEGERLEIERLAMPWRMRFDGTTIRLEQFEIQSELGQLTGGGSIRLADLQQNATKPTTVQPDSHRLSPTVKGFLHQPLFLQGNLDIAQLATMLPKTMQVRQGTTITSGKATFDLMSSRTKEGHRWTGSLETAALEARDATHAWRWEQPIRLSASIVENQGLQIEAIRCDSEFLHVHASGDAKKLTARGDFDLDKLAKQLGQFVDLNEWQLHGQGEAAAVLQTANNRYRFDIEALLTAVQIEFQNKTLANEPKLNLLAQAEGVSHQNMPQGFQTANFELRSDDDTLKLTVDSTANSGKNHRFDLQAKGNVERWLVRLQPWVQLDDWNVQGSGVLTAKGRMRNETVEIDSAELTVADLTAKNPAWNIHDKKLLLQLRGAAYLPKTNSMQLEEATLNTAAAFLRLRGFQAAFPNKDKPSLTGDFSFQTRLEQIDAWRVPAGGRAKASRIAGDIQGTLRFAKSQTAGSDNVTATLDATATNLTLLEYVPKQQNVPAGYRPAWQEPTARLQASALYDTKQDQIRIQTGKLEADSLTAQVSGLIDRVSTQQTVNVQGVIDYDLAKWSPIVASYTGKGVHLSGKDRATFELAGSIGKVTNPTNAQQPLAVHWSRRLQGNVSAGWQEVDLFGLPVSAGRVKATLGKGAIQVAPFDVGIGEGKFLWATTVQLDPTPQMVYLPKGQVLREVRITKEVSAKMLKFIAPVLADATQVEGTFSLSLAGGQMPLGEPKQADIAGQLDVQSMRISPDGVAKEWVQIIQEIIALGGTNGNANGTPTAGQRQLAISIQEKAIPFRLVKGRVHHQGLEFTIGEVTVQSFGSVGLDETLDLVLQVPIDEKLVKRTPILKSLKGQSLQFVIRGTFHRPKIDKKALQNLSQQVLKSAAKDVLQDQLDKALRGLFQPK